MLDPQFVTDHWSLSKVSFGEMIQSYPTRKVFRVYAEEGQFAAKVDSQPPDIETILRSSAVYDFLASRHFSPVPGWLKTKNGDPAASTPHQSVTMLEYIDGGHPEPTPTTWRELGLIAARLNSIADFPYPYGVPTQGVIRELTQAAESHPHPAQFREFINLLPPLLGYSRLGLIHGEINLSNAMRRRNGELVLIDWDEAGTGPTVLEAGYPLLTVFLTEDLDFQPELAASFYQGYYGQSQPGNDEKEFLFCSALLHALRYMQYGNQQKRWERVCYAVANKTNLLAAIF